MEATEGRNGSGSKAILSYTVMYSEHHFWGYGDPFIGVNSRGTELWPIPNAKVDTQNLAGNSPCLQPQCLKSLPVLRCTSKPHGRLNGWGSVGVLVLFEARLAGWASFSAVLERPVVKEIPTCQLLVWRNFRIKDVPKKILVPPKKVFRLNVFQIVVTFGLCHVSQIFSEKTGCACLLGGVISQQKQTPQLTASYQLYPIGSMYAIYGNIYHQYTPNVSIYTIHGSYGYIVMRNDQLWPTRKVLLGMFESSYSRVISTCSYSCVAIFQYVPGWLELGIKKRKKKHDSSTTHNSFPAQPGLNLAVMWRSRHGRQA